MDYREKTKGTIKNEQSRENQRDNQEWTIERKPKGQSRENQRDNQEWTIERKPKGQSRMNNRDTLATFGIQDKD